MQYYTMTKKLKSALFLLPLLALLTCDNGLDDLLEFQRTMIPITDGLQLTATFPDGAILAIMNDIEMPNTGLAQGIEINKNLTITAWEGTKTISAGTIGINYPFFKVQLGGNLTLRDPRSKGTLVLEGNASRTESLIQVDGANASLTMNDGVILKGNGDPSLPPGNGGGVYIEIGSFIMNGGIISGNHAQRGGGVNIANGGSFTMNGGTISGNFAIDNGSDTGHGGGVYIGPNSVSIRSTFLMKGGTIRKNDAQNNGGGVSVQAGFGAVVSGEYIMTGGRIYDNEALLLNGGNQLYIFPGPPPGTAIIMGEPYTSGTPYDNDLP